MSVLWSEEFAGGSEGGGFVTRFISPVVNAPVGTGDVIAITPPAGQKVRVVYLRSSNTAGTSNNIEMRVAGVAVKARGNISPFQGGNLTHGDPNGWNIGGGSNSTVGISESLAYIEGAVDEVVTGHCSGAMSQSLNYMYMFGE